MIGSVEELIAQLQEFPPHRKVRIFRRHGHVLLPITEIRERETGCDQAVTLETGEEP